MARVIGLLGGVASGKSTVARLLGDAGWVVLDADAEARAAVERAEVAAALSDRFGADLFDAAGRLDRALLARRAFADPAGKAALDAIVHPVVRRALAAALRAAGDRPVVLDVPLLLGSPLESLVDVWVFVEAPASARESRATTRGWAPGERERRETLQADLAVKRARADHVLENSGSIEDLGRGVHALLRVLGTPLTARERRDDER